LIYPYQRLMVAGFQIDLRLHVEAVIDNQIKAVALADWRNGAVSAILEQWVDLPLAGEIGRLAKLLPQFGQQDVMRCRQDGKHIFVIPAHDNAFGETVARNATGFCRSYRRWGPFMNHHVIRYMLIQIFREGWGYGHGAAPGCYPSICWPDIG